MSTIARLETTTAPSGRRFAMQFVHQSHRSELNRRPLDYESSALPLSYCGTIWFLCPGADSNRDALRHHPLKMACLPISPPGHDMVFSLQLSAISFQKSGI